MNVTKILKRMFFIKKSYHCNKNNNRDYSIWIFGEWFGNKCSDNVLCFANYVAKHGDSSLKLYWLCNPGIDTTRLDKRIVVVDRNKPEAKKLQKNAGVAVMNQGYDDFCDYGENYLGNAVTVNLWHGMMWKKIGFDMYSDNILTRLYIHAIIKERDYSLFCSPSDCYTHYFCNGFKLSPKIAIPIGLPRNELLFDSSKVKECRQIIESHLLKLGIKIRKETKIITYMPTFRDTTTNSFSFSDINNDLFDDFMLENDFVIIQKAHEKNVLNGVGYGNGFNQRIINVDDINPQELLAATDILITDYSSCLFDFLLLDRPIIQFVYDYDYYSKKDRGLYYPWQEVDCGHVVFDEKDLLSAIIDCLKTPDLEKEKRNLVRNRFMTYECSTNNKMIYKRINDEISRIQIDRKECGRDN